MTYAVGKKVFKTLEEASRYAALVLRQTGYVLAVTESKKKATHEFEKEVAR